MGRSSFHVHLSAKQELSSPIARTDGTGGGRERPCPRTLLPLLRARVMTRFLSLVIASVGMAAAFECRYL